MKIPKSVKVGGLTYSINETEALTLGQDYTGEILYRDLIINLRPAPKQFMESSLLHELIHAIYDNLGYKDHDEKKVEEMARAFYQVIVDNPDMFKEDA